MKMVLWVMIWILAVVLMVFIGKIIKKTSLGKEYVPAVVFIIRIIIVAVSAELLIFNFDSFRLPADGCDERVLNINEAEVKNYDTNTFVTEGKSGYIEFKNIDCKVKSVTIKSSIGNRENMTFDLDVSDDSNQNYRTNIASMTAIKGSESCTTIINMSGNVHNLKIKFVPDGENISIYEISINTPVKLQFNLVRIFAIILSLLIIYAICMSRQLRAEAGSSTKLFKIMAYGMTIGVIAVSLAITINSKGFNLVKDFSAKSGNQMTQELVDAFEAGQVSLLKEVPPELLELDNPYDWSERTNADIDYAWDHLLYEGKYYSYYGIAPVVLVFLPYHLITDCYFPSTWAVFLFGAIGILFLTKFYMCLIETFFHKLGINIALSGLAIIQMVSSIMFCFNVPQFYEIAQSSGFACVAIGAYMLLKSGVIGPEKLSRKRLSLSGIFLSLAVLCRPTLAVYCIVALVFIALGTKKDRSIRYFIAALLPYAIIGGIQMLYNYMRFGSVMDFGIQYSLTINDFTQTQFHPEFALIGYYNYFFAIPQFTEAFPYIDTSRVLTFEPNGYYFVATRSAVGLFVKALPCVSYLYGIKAYRRSTSPDKKKYAVLLTAGCIVAPLIIVFSIWESGYGVRYAADFAWEFVIGALIIAYNIYIGCRESMRRHLDRAMALAVMVCAILSIVQICNWISVA